MISLIKKKLNYDECPICFKSKILKELSCNHDFCSCCLKKWFERSNLCPMCRNVITDKKILRYDVEIIGLLEDESLNPYKYLSQWKKQICVTNKHKFTLSKYDDTIILFCKRCEKARFFNYS